MKSIGVEEFNENVFKKIGKDWMLIGATSNGKTNAMTASWGGLGIMWGKNVAYVFIRDSRYTKTLVDETDMMSISFFTEEYKKMLGYMGRVSGRDEDKIAVSELHIEEGDMDNYKAPVFKEAEMTMICKKLYAGKMNKECFIDMECIEKWYENDDYHTMYVVEIKDILVQ